ncbi:protein Skeletor, isoforms B/C [Uranotaenia lowii]|uniref:protein Skeletor, isoforms B/C n=1 Tax=Uranotaenia lowii TaxID=190385 RepID=UPI0024794685|nr:protein Skeletor, isoforms B/C [Uranotaenia lowii]XP_055594131.1 protein Skeletor, isoforms B/C [Uranotaenia lowii]XP_055594141.1 protein Skeletor, isoforms B/C [Uranotaenia lowii]XP_055594143.1 protein Skeletor, isoforms B/C [Uranotaenia lowii]
MLSRRGFILAVAVAFAICSLISTADALQGYYGTKIGDLTQLHHGVSGVVYAVDARTLFLKNFNYDGEGPAAYFYVGNTRAPSNKGAYRLRDERGRSGVLRRYRNEDLTLSLPEGKTLRDLKWFSIWCDDFSVNFGDVVIRNDLDFPRPTKIGQLGGIHDVSSDNIVIVDAQTLLIPNFNYDGEAPDAKFWVGRGAKPSPQGIRIPDENGKETPLRRYDKKTIVLTLPGDLTVFDIGHFGVWCEAFTVDFGHVRIPDRINVPPSLKMLGISPQSKLNCEVLLDDLAFEVRWAVAGESIVIQLVARLEDGEYMSFGVSPDTARSVMVGADAAVVWIDKATGKGYAQDYYLDAKSQCSGGRGSCPDTRITENSNSIRLLNAAMVNGYSIVTYQRPLRATDHLDLPIVTNASQAIIWAIGPLNQRYEVSYHSQFLKSTKQFDFGRQPYWNCPTPESDQQKQPENPQKLQSLEPNRRVDAMAQRPNKLPVVERQPATARPPAKAGAWEIPPIQCDEPEDGVFYAQMGPTGGKQGYPAITGHVGWGISWYINGLLIPEINVVRGKTYTFVVEGGHDPEFPAKYHPFYITDDPVGGYDHQEEDVRRNTRIFAGVHMGRNGQLIPTGVGRSCYWTPNPDGPPADAYPSFGAYQRSLTLKCDPGEPGIITWTPDADTPDTVFYQCFTHRYLGWRINVHDSCSLAAPSEIDEVYADPDESFSAEASIRHESKLLPADSYHPHHDNYLQKDENEHLKNHKMNPEHPEGSFNLDLENDPEMAKIIEEGIRAAEDLEERLKSNQTYSNATIGYNHTHPDSAGQTKPILSSSGLPVYLRPPNNGPMFRPVKLPMRRPIAVERRPANARPTRPFVIPQPSMIVNHYQKNVSPLMRPFMPKSKMPIKAIAPILLLGEPTEIKPFRKPAPQSMIQPVEMMMVKPAKQITYMVPDVSPHLAINLKKDQQTPINLPLRQTRRPMHKEPINIKPMFKSPYEVTENKTPIDPPVNHGFEPSSVVVESGFKPIYRRNDMNAEYDDEIRHHGVEMIQRRQDDDIDEAIESDALMIGSGEPQRQSFEPMFIPSPLESMAMERKSGNEVDNYPEERLTGDLKEMNVENGEDKMAMADERVDAYYLPPATQKVMKVYPEGSVVSYDGKAVLDVSLLNSPSSVRQEAVKSASKTEQLVRETPQFGPFRGDVPPIFDYKAPDSSPIYGSRGSSAVQPPVSEYANPLVPGGITQQESKDIGGKPISTKLSIVKSSEEGREQSRKRREAHHHPDHQGDNHDDGWDKYHNQKSGAVSPLSTITILLTPLLVLIRRFL